MRAIKTDTRRYDIDLIRIVLILSVFFFHIGMFFNGFGWHIKNNSEISWLNPVMAYLHRWRMPLLFFVSGVGTFYALGKRGIGKYIKERAARLLIPLIFGVFFVVPPQVYVEKHNQYDSFLNFIPHLTEGTYPKGNMSWHHLWFVLYLFICSLLALPVIVLFRSRFKAFIVRKMSCLFRFRGTFLLLAVPLFLVQIVLTRYFSWETHGLFDDWAYLTYSYLFFIYGFILFSDQILIKQIIQQRRINGYVATGLSSVFFLDYFYSIDPYVPETFQMILGALLEWSIGISIIGYAGKYLNRDWKSRKYLNEGIYPFYILHQTVIICIGFLLFNKNMANSIKFLLLTTGSLAICLLIYILLIRPFNLTRVLFGMRKVKKEHKGSRQFIIFRKAS